LLFRQYSVTSFSKNAKKYALFIFLFLYRNNVKKCYIFYILSLSGVYLLHVGLYWTFFAENIMFFQENTFYLK